MPAREFGRRANLKKRFQIRNVIINLKEKIFAVYWIVPILGVPLWASFFRHTDTQNLATVIGGSLGFCYFIQKQKLEEARFFRELFLEFNDRYQKIKDRLPKEWPPKEADLSLSGDARASAIEYFNLCSEEYLLYKRGYIPLEVWHSWVLGMNQYSYLKLLWSDEAKTESYYGFNPHNELAWFT